MKGPEIVEMVKKSFFLRGFFNFGDKIFFTQTNCKKQN